MPPFLHKCCNRHVRRDIVYVLPITDPKFVGVRFTVKFFQGKECNHPYQVSYSGDREDGTLGILTNCDFSKKENGDVDKEIVLIPLSYKKFPSEEPVNVIAEFMFPDDRFNDGSLNMCFADEINDMDGGTIQSQIIVNAIKGDTGLSAYEIAVKHGFKGTEKEWIEGHNAYELWLEAGNEGTKEDFFYWLYENCYTDEFLRSEIDKKLVDVKDRLQTMERNAICIGEIVGTDEEVVFTTEEEDEPIEETPTDNNCQEAIKDLQERMTAQEKLNVEQQIQINNNTTENEKQQILLENQQEIFEDACTEEDIDSLFE